MSEADHKPSAHIPTRALLFLALIILLAVLVVILVGLVISLHVQTPPAQSSNTGSRSSTQTLSDSD